MTHSPWYAGLAVLGGYAWRVIPKRYDKSKPVPIGTALLAILASVLIVIAVIAIAGMLQQ